MVNKRFDDNLTAIGKKWYEEYQKTEEPCKHSISEVDVLNLKEEGKKYLDAETAVFQVKQSKSKDSNVRWLKVAVKQGTTSDKVAASIVLIQDNPKYNLSRLTNLVSQVRGAKHNQCCMIIASLKELFLTDLLHPNFKLLKLEQQDLDKLNLENESDAIVKTSAARNRLLAHWYYEDQLLEQYERFVLNLSAVASDTVDTNREKAIAAMTDLLIGNSEQEHKLLELLVNKIGDPSSKVGSKAVFCVNRLLHEHPNMKLVVLREVEKLLFRKNMAQRTQYYAICLLAQFVLDAQSNEIAATLIEVYFAFFKACLKKGEPDSRMMAAILTGVNRAYPFANIDSSVMNQHIDSVYKVVHFGSFNVSLSALSLLHQITGKDESQASRFHSVFYRKLLDPQIGTANKRAMFLNLLYRVLQQDQSVLRLYAFVKRILQVTVYFPANMACAMLYVVSKILRSNKHLRRTLLEPKAIKIEKEEVCEVKEEDVYEVKDELSDTEDVEVIDEIKVEDEVDSNIMLSNVTTSADTAPEAKPDVKLEVVTKSYDPFCRNPLYAGVTQGFNTELAALAKHFHPSVALFANAIIQDKPVDYTGDPLEDLTLIRFLDRYVFKNPKKLDDKKVQRKNDLMAQRAGYAPKGLRSLPVDSAAYLNETEERIPVDELFLYRFLKQKREIKRRIKKEDDDNEDLESVNSEEFNEMLDNLKSGQDFDDLDIAADIVPRKKKGKATEESDDDDDGEDSQSEDDDVASEDDFDEDNEHDDEELQDLDGLADMDDEDLSDMEFNDGPEEGDDDLEPELISGLKRKLQKQQRGSKDKGKDKKKRKGIDSDIFVSAEKFAEMLEEQSKTRGKHGGSDALSSIDGASAKQIDWEIKRNQRLRGSFGNKKRKNTAKQTSSSNKRTKRLKR
ncbi:PREDICTED: CCAAT/enhancer-binding protein zeta [Dinoponera quadriceps]|uniref:CCAAT/enhancer-binding protein zeta n=1 Tax=Dinoponera quadriceps TaxID=609295 RepID=A0A6P3Y0A4_DINQU|nr:PREDICTED: CCAAT/enhancer-binding protein zeta [Dinoponera quadriceps]